MTAVTAATGGISVPVLKRSRLGSAKATELLNNVFMALSEKSPNQVAEVVRAGRHDDDRVAGHRPPPLPPDR